MSYRGRPSKGCESCRSRKVKCDEEKPVCNRCRVCNYECKYRDQGDLLFRNQTAIAAQKAEGSWRKRAKSHQRITGLSSASQQSPPSSTHESPQNKYRGTSPQGESSPGVSSSILTLDSLSLGQQIQPDLQRLAYERFVYDFVLFDSPNHDPSTLSSSFWNFIPPLYQDAAEGSSLKTIVHAVAYANFSARCNALHVQALAEENLAKGFRLLQSMLRDKKQAPSDHALCSVFLLGAWETITTPSHDGTFLAHKEGANALIQLRTMEEFYSNAVSARLYESSYAQMLIGNIHDAKPPNLPARNFVAARGILPTVYSNPGVNLIQLIHEAATLHAQWHEFKAKPNPPLSRQVLREILNSTVDLDSEFQSWEATVPAAWRYQMERNTPEARSTHEPRWRELILGGRGAPEEIHSYPTLKNCWIWMFYRTSRLFLLRDLVEILNWMLKLPEATTNTPLDLNNPATIRRSLDNITLSIEHAFATSHLVTIVEKSCSAVLGSFTVPIYGKSNDDVVGMRGYTSFWSLGVVDSMLRAGLVPDAGSLPTSSNSTTASRDMLGSYDFSQFRSQPAPSPSVFKLPTQNIHPLYHKPDTAVPTVHDSTRLSYLQDINQSPPIANSTPETPPSLGSVPPIEPKIQRKHPFESKAAHPNDYPADLPSFDFSTTQPSRIDVAARREWINKLMYYIGTKLGIKKGLGIVYVEGYVDVSKREVERLFGSWDILCSRSYSLLVLVQH